MVSPETNNILLLPFTKEEIKRALFDLNLSKAPGPDEFTTMFYQNAWEIIGEELLQQFSKVLNKGKDLKDWNPMVVMLIPKTKEAKSMKESTD